MRWSREIIVGVIIAVLGSAIYGVIEPTLKPQPSSLGLDVKALYLPGDDNVWIMTETNPVTDGKLVRLEYSYDQLDWQKIEEIITKNNDLNIYRWKIPSLAYGNEIYFRAQFGGDNQYQATTSDITKVRTTELNPERAQQTSLKYETFEYNGVMYPIITVSAFAKVEDIEIDQYENSVTIKVAKDEGVLALGINRNLIDTSSDDVPFTVSIDGEIWSAQETYQDNNARLLLISIPPNSQVVKIYGE
ncbi:MAG: hypothetical protein AB1608_01385 [Thermoproteota archaeon]